MTASAILNLPSAKIAPNNQASSQDRGGSFEKYLLQSNESLPAPSKPSRTIKDGTPTAQSDAIEHTDIAQSSLTPSPTSDPHVAQDQSPITPVSLDLQAQQPSSDAEAEIQSPIVPIKIHVSEQAIADVPLISLEPGQPTGFADPDSLVPALNHGPVGVVEPIGLSVSAGGDLSDAAAASAIAQSSVNEAIRTEQTAVSGSGVGQASTTVNTEVGSPTQTNLGLFQGAGNGQQPAPAVYEHQLASAPSSQGESVVGAVAGAGGQAKMVGAEADLSGHIQTTDQGQVDADSLSVSGPGGSDQDSGDEPSSDTQQRPPARQTVLPAATGRVAADFSRAADSLISQINDTPSPLGPPASSAGPGQAVSGGGSLLGSSPSQSDSTPADANIGRVIRGMRGVVHQNGGAVTLRLSPPEMGIVRIEMQIDSGAVKALLHTEHEAARTLLNQQLGQLRHALEAHGLFVDKLGVQTMAQGSDTLTSDRDADQSAANDGRSQGQHHGAGGGRTSDAKGGELSDADLLEPQSLTFESALNMVA